MLAALTIVAITNTLMPNVYELTWTGAEPESVIEAQCHKNKLRYSPAGVAFGHVGKMYVGMRLESGDSIYCKIRTYSPPTATCPKEYGEFTPFVRWTFTGTVVEIEGGAL
jgi:hypothetical protein